MLEEDVSTRTNITDNLLNEKKQLTSTMKKTPPGVTIYPSENDTSWSSTEAEADSCPSP